jgi:hypothetical protein
MACGAAIAYECSVPERYCAGSFRPGFRGPRKETPKLHGSPEEVRRCHRRYEKLKRLGKVEIYQKSESRMGSGYSTAGGYHRE